MAFYINSLQQMFMIFLTLFMKLLKGSTTSACHVASQCPFHATSMQAWQARYQPLSLVIVFIPILVVIMILIQ